MVILLCGWCDPGKRLVDVQTPDVTGCYSGSTADLGDDVVPVVLISGVTSVDCL
jgi:hypothetical protein